MNLLALITLYCAAVAAQAPIPVHWAITAGNGASLGDCVYSLLHENQLGAHWITHSYPVKTVSICYSENNIVCIPAKPHFGEMWTPVLCVAHYYVEYASGHPPESIQSFHNSHGLCRYRPMGNNVGGFRHLNYCDCEKVGVQNACPQLQQHA